MGYKLIIVLKGECDYENFIKRIVRTIITGYVLKWIKNKIEGNSKENNLKGLFTLF